MNGLSKDVDVDKTLNNIAMSLEMIDSCEKPHEKQLLQGATLDCLKLVCLLEP